MGKKDFIALADVLRPLDVPEDVLSALCSFMRSCNPRFMEGRWRGYLRNTCGPGGGKVKA